MRQYKVGVLGATGMVGQRFVALMEHHPWFTLTTLAASPRSAGKSYAEAVEGRWAMETPIPKSIEGLVVYDAVADMEKIAAAVDFVFSAVDMNKEEIYALEEAYARLECPVVSNNSAHRWTADVPMVIPELNAEHLAVIASQRARLGTERGFIAVKSNCSLQSYMPALYPLHKKYGLEHVTVCTYQAISGAGKTLESAPEIADNVIPYIGGEEEKSEREPLKILGTVTEQGIENASGLTFTAQCVRVPVSDGHLAAVFMYFASGKEAPSMEEIKACWAAVPSLDLPSAPKGFIHYFEEENRPQTRLDRGLEHGMAISVGRLREDVMYHYKFVCLSHNTLRGAAGGAVLMADQLCSEGYI
ncbi:MAG: aspartate-semialdehyde dehydrogenase [Oscillospiraceae bacterium]|nr:aspartate-semialdehyde dehydrogenase [Oscillospiraceae bacterium]